MSPGQIFQLTPGVGNLPDINNIFTIALTDLINNFGKQCMLIYPGSPEINCNNCIVDSYTNKSTNIYLTGGPQPFGQGQLCPVCGGQGKIQSSPKTKIIKMIIYWTPTDFQTLPGNISMPYGDIETEGFIKDLPDVLQSRVMIVELPIQPIVRARYELSAQPSDPYQISPGVCFNARWRRKG